MYLETSGDATFTALVEDFTASADWAKTGLMVRDSLSPYSSHYSIFKTKGAGLAQQYRSCTSCTTEHHGTLSNFPSVWLRVVKEGNVLRAFYKPSDFEKHDPWIQYGYELSMNNIRSSGYFIGIAVTARTNGGVASAQVSNVHLSRTCSSETITVLQCDQASNCESGPVSGTCYPRGEVPLWETSDPVASILDKGSTVSVFGCNPDYSVSANRALDGTTDKWYCGRSDVNGVSGWIVTPTHQRMSIAQGLRVYAHNNCPNCDPVSYIFEGRTGPSSEWEQISAGDLPWKNWSSYPRNSYLGVNIQSSYSSGDNSKIYTEVSFADDPALLNLYMEYKLTWTATRVSSQATLQLAEVEVPGLLKEAPEMPVLQHSGTYTKSVVHGSTDITLLEGYGGGTTVDRYAFNGNTYKFYMNKNSATSTPGTSPFEAPNGICY